MGRQPDSPPPEKLNQVSGPDSAREKLALAGWSILLLIPCFWTERIQAGDLSSHLYNAWLARLAAAGALPGLSVKNIWTNTLADWILSALLGPCGPVWTERIVICVAVLVFFWGGFYLLRVIAGGWCWTLAPCLLMLTYGLIFHFGFLNHYLSTGLCLWVIALLWRPSRSRRWAAGVLAAIAILAHIVPVLWCAAVLIYIYAARLAPPWLRMALPAIALLILVAAQWAATSSFLTRTVWGELNQVSAPLEISGADQVWLFGPKYLIIAGALLGIWGALLLNRLDRGGFFSDPLVQLWCLNMAAFLLLPAAVQFPPFQHPYAYIPQRISLFTALLLSMVVADASFRRGIAAFAWLAASVYFGFVLIDAHVHNDLETQLTRLVRQLPPGQRVVAAIGEPDKRIPATQRAIDGACLGRCFNYGNYEAATRVFRVRADGPNPYVADSMQVVKEIEDGTHLVTPREAPLYAVCQADSDPSRLYLRKLTAGERVCSFTLGVSPQIQAGSIIGTESRRDSTAPGPRTNN